MVIDSMLCSFQIKIPQIDYWNAKNVSGQSITTCYHIDMEGFFGNIVALLTFHVEAYKF